MNTSIYIAKRYLFSGKKMHAINIISGISMLGVLIGSAALLIILSVFNGFEKVILSLYSNFTPEIKIETKLGKTFNPNTPYFTSLHKDAHVFSFTEVLQEKALIKYGDKPFLGTVMGVSDDFLKNPQLDSTIASGSFTLKSGNQNFAVIGATIQGNLGINVHDELSSMQIYSPRRDAENSANPLNEFVVRSINPSGVFAIQQEFDDIAVTPIGFARDLLDQPVDVSSLQLNFKRGTNIDAMQKNIQDKIGRDFTVKNRKEQNSELYKTLNYESWAVYMILTFVLIIAIFNIIGSLTMLVIDKRKDIAILSGLGANKNMIQGIFFFEGMMITAIGCIIGIMLGAIFCLLQQHYGWIKMGAKMSVLDSYPIDLKVKDFGLVLLTVGGISVIAAGISARLSIKGLDEIKQDL
ncbi:FtsX-like permease family protein [Mucilaginibacter sp. cycad4]|uniref:FtsX-like permease family protein n=1 Tax=Mucilaginibacter sp. cycad4 TaxID=3342096 RepID=UPI002AAC4447|nr:FtsX-like permease family protein [Mucilaginibacter gossypii]WPU98825.1 FtsX-like permease family protein [Mucilaginibacter gossypii]